MKVLSAILLTITAMLFILCIIIGVLFMGCACPIVVKLLYGIGLFTLGVFGLIFVVVCWRDI